MNKLCIVIPAYNEEKRIGKTLERYSLFFEKARKNKELDYEILVVINNTKDKTESIVKSFSKKNKRIIYLNLIRGGKGYAVVSGFADALKRKNELIGFVDADLSTSPEEYLKLVKNISSYDGIIASRYIKGAVLNPPQTISRVISSRIYNFYIRALLFFPYSDTQCGAKLFKRKTLEVILPSLTMSHWAFDVDLLYISKLNGFKIKEFPTYWSDKTHSTINFLTAGPMMALAILRLRLLNSPLKGFIKLYDNLPFKIKF